jgi:hypothetical protein
MANTGTPSAQQAARSRTSSRLAAGGVTLPAAPLAVDQLVADFKRYVDAAEGPDPARLHRLSSPRLWTA